MLHFFRRDDGVITVYFAIVIVALFMFNAVLIDYARILAASKQTENAAQAGVRSVLAGYYPALLDYGLFGLDSSKAQDAFTTAVAGNLPPEGDEYWHYLDLIMNSQTAVAFPPDGMLSNPAVFEQQILEEMKFKAPIQLFVDILKEQGEVEALKKDMENDQVFMNITGQVSECRKNREAGLTKLNPLVHEIGDKLKRIANSDIDWALSTPPPTPEEQSDHEEARRQKIEALQRDLSRCGQLLQTARTANENLANIINSNYQLLIEYSDQPEKLVLQNEFFTEYQRELDQLASLCAKSRLFSSDISTIEGLLNRRDIEEEARRAANFDGTDAAQAGREKAGGLPDVDPGKVDEIADQLAKIITSSEEFRQASLLAENVYGQAASQRTFLDSNKESAAGQASIKTLDVLTQLSSMLTGCRDELWINEYVLLHFNCFTTDNGGKDRLSQVRNRAKLGNEEAEFVLYGLPAAKANTIAAGSAIYLIRFGVRFSYGLRLFNYLVDPKLILIAAASYGAIMGAEDERQLLSGKKVALYPSPKCKLMLSYKDYLRLFMLGTDNTTKIKRLQALVHTNTGQDLTKTPAYAEGAASTSLKLWFITRPLQAAGKIQGDRYVITRQAAMYY
ncbi:MAG: TadE/TadG family type IV pilus assembly protein [Syntrophomonadaceae bacterium]|jgi:hypothetical protein